MVLIYIASKKRLVNEGLARDYMISEKRGTSRVVVRKLEPMMNDNRQMTSNREDISGEEKEGGEERERRQNLAARFGEG